MNRCLLFQERIYSSFLVFEQVQELKIASAVIKNKLTSKTVLLNSSTKVKILLHFRDVNSFQPDKIPWTDARSSKHKKFLITQLHVLNKNWGIGCWKRICQLIFKPDKILRAIKHERKLKEYRCPYLYTPGNLESTKISPN